LSWKVSHGELNIRGGYRQKNHIAIYCDILWDIAINIAIYCEF
jgi:hypothetical protein